MRKTGTICFPPECTGPGKKEEEEEGYLIEQMDGVCLAFCLPVPKIYVILFYLYFTNVPCKMMHVD